MSGEYVLRVSDAAIEAIEWNGQNYTNRSFDAKAGNDILDVIVTVTTNSSSISGIVSDGTATLNAGAAVIAFPVDQDGWSNYGLNPARLKSALTTIDGRFRLAGLPKGDYYLLAVPASQERAWLDPTFLAGRAGRALHVQIDRSDATISNVALSLVR
jgi:hypothetical protein